MRTPRAGLLVALLVAVVAAAPVAAQTVTVSLEDGDQDETFVFEGHGFAPDERVSMRFTAPDGQSFMLLDNHGDELVLTVAADGTFSIGVRPVEVFIGAPAGVWQAEFCPESGEFCLAGTFTIRV